MANFIENFGLGDLTLTEEDTIKFLGYIAKQGKLLVGYKGTYINHNLGNAQFILRTALNEEENRFEVIGVDTHSTGKCIWECRIFGDDPTPSSFGPLQRRCLLVPQDSREGMTIINIVNSEVLPSYLEGDIIKLQVVAFPVLINYFADEESYINHQSAKYPGSKRVILANGAIFPSGYLLNRDPRRSESERDSDLDDHVLVRGTVKKCFTGQAVIKDKQLTKFVRCIIDTDFGELELVHPYKMVGKEQRENMRVGATVSAICVLSGDAAIYEYEDGIVLDEENNLRLMRSCAFTGDEDRLRLILDKNCVFYIETTGQTLDGADKVIHHFRNANEAVRKEENFYIYPATISSLDDYEETDIPPLYGPGKRCHILAAGNAEHYESITFIDLNELGRVTRITLSCDGRYRFKIDRPHRKPQIYDEFAAATNAATPILMRAKFAGIIGWTEELPEQCEDCTVFKSNAELMMEQVAAHAPSDNAKAFEAIFSYLFAKAIEKRIKLVISDGGPAIPDINYSPVDALKGTIDTDLPEQLHKKVVEGMAEGALLYLGFRQFVSESEPDEETYNRELISSLILVQQLGAIYADKMAIAGMGK